MNRPTYCRSSGNLIGTSSCLRCQLPKEKDQ